MPGHVLRAAATAYEPRTRAASAPGRQPPVRRRGRGASPGAGRGHRPPNPAAQGPSWTPRTTPSPTQLLTGPRGRTAANIAASGPSDRAAGRVLVSATYNNLTADLLLTRRVPCHQPGAGLAGWAKNLGVSPLGSRQQGEVDPPAWPMPMGTAWQQAGGGSYT